MSENTGYKVYEIMSPQPITVKPSTSIRDCAIIMAKHDVNSLIVVDEENSVIGILTDEDIVRKVVINNFDSEKVKAYDIMTKNPYTIEPEADLSLAVEMMKELGIRHLPVTKNNVLVGMLTAKDIIKIQPELFEIFKVKEETEVLTLDEIGYCDICGKPTKKLYVLDDLLLCKECFESFKNSSEEIKFKINKAIKSE